MKAFQDHYPEHLSHGCGCGSNNAHGHRIEIRGRVKAIKGRNVVAEATMTAAGVATARGEVVAIQMPQNFGA